MLSTHGSMQGTGREHRDFFFPLYWPFLIPQWPSRLWWLLLLDYVPGINLLVLRGWRLSVVRRMAWGEQQPLPALHLLPYLRTGAFLWTLTFFYTFVPIIVIAYLGIGGLADLVGDFRTLWRILTGQETMTLWQFVTTELSETLASMGVEISWVVVSTPMHRAAMIRFAVTGQHRSFLHIPANALFILRNFGAFVSLWIFSLAVGLLMVAASAIFLSTLIGAVLIPLITLPLYYWSTAYEFGELAFKLRNRLYPGAVPPARIAEELGE